MYLPQSLTCCCCCCGCRYYPCNFGLIRAKPKHSARPESKSRFFLIDSDGGGSGQCGGDAYQRFSKMRNQEPTRPSYWQQNIQNDRFDLISLQHRFLSTIVIMLLLCSTLLETRAQSSNLQAEFPKESFSSSYSILSLNTEDIYKMRPSIFFEKYYKCRLLYVENRLGYGSKVLNSITPSKTLIKNIHTSMNINTEDDAVTDANIVDDDDNNNSEKSADHSTTMRKSGWCPTACDGVTMWPATIAGGFHSISCQDILETFLKTPNDAGSTMGYDDTNNNNNNNNPNHEDWPLLADQADQRSRSTVATRHCMQNGEWEPKANYSACGLDTDKLLILSQEQLETIFEIRDRMTRIKYKYKESEQAFIDCVDNVLAAEPSSLPEPFCPRTFDSWTCFNDTPAGQVVYFPCPEFVLGFNPRNQAHKTCTIQGQWKVHHETSSPWTNYTSCVDYTDLRFRNMIVRLHIVGYSISLVALLISLIIFLSFKTLSSQTRIRIHKNLFLSFIMNNFMWIIWYTFILDENILYENGFFCQALHVVLHYFLVCNYYWMFCEGLYLHTILVVAFISDEKLLKYFYIIGWGIPAIFSATYATLRALSPEAKNCWIDNTIHTLILHIPVIISLVLNIFFLINIVRVLVTKLQAVYNADTHQTRKAVRAILILIPLFGLNFILTPFRPETDDTAARAYEIFSAIVLSLQGFCVSIPFCYMNGEVLSVLKKKWNQFMLMHRYSQNRRGSSYHGTEVSIHLSNYDSNEHNDNNNNNSTNNNNINNGSNEPVHCDKKSRIKNKNQQHKPIIHYPR